MKFWSVSTLREQKEEEEKQSKTQALVKQRRRNYSTKYTVERRWNKEIGGVFEHLCGLRETISAYGVDITYNSTALGQNHNISNK